MVRILNILFVILFLVPVGGCREIGAWNIQPLSGVFEAEARWALGLWGEKESDFGLNVMIPLNNVQGIPAVGGAQGVTTWMPANPSWVIVVDEVVIDEERETKNCLTRGVSVIAHEIGHYLGYRHSNNPENIMHEKAPCEGSLPTWGL